MIDVWRYSEDFLRWLRAAAVDAHDRTGKEGGKIRAEKRDDRSDVFSGAKALDREMVFKIILQGGRILLRDSCKVSAFRIDRARRHCGNDDIVLGKLSVDGFHIAVESALGGHVSSRPIMRLGGERGKMDDSAPMAFHHGWQEVPV